MMLLHSGMSKEGQYVVGYAVRYRHTNFIIDNDGVHTQVKADTTRVYTDKTNIKCRSMINDLIDMVKKHNYNDL